MSRLESYDKVPRSGPRRNLAFFDVGLVSLDVQELVLLVIIIRYNTLVSSASDDKL